MARRAKREVGLEAAHSTWCHPHLLLWRDVRARAHISSQEELGERNVDEEKCREEVVRNYKCSPARDVTN